MRIIKVRGTYHIHKLYVMPESITEAVVIWFKGYSRLPQTGTLGIFGWWGSDSIG